MSKTIRKINLTLTLQILNSFCNCRVLEEREELVTGKRFYLVEFERALSSMEELYLLTDHNHKHDRWAKLAVHGRWTWTPNGQEDSNKKDEDNDPSYTQGYRDGNTGLRWL
jgi:hypothetical protein